MLQNPEDDPFFVKLRGGPSNNSKLCFETAVVQNGYFPYLALVVSDRIAQQVCNWGGGAHLEHVSVSPGTCSCENFLNFESPLKWLKMQLKLRWCGETYILSTRKNVDRKKLFSTKSHTV